MTDSKNPDPCVHCGSFRWDDPRPCWNCAQLTTIAITMAPTTIFTSAEILQTLQKIVKIGASEQAAQEVVRCAMNMHINCVVLADEIVTGWQREQSRELSGMRKIYDPFRKRR